MLKYLRIAVTALSVTVCVLLVALWVRARFAMDKIQGPLVGSSIIATSRHSGLSIGLISSPFQSWRYNSYPSDSAVSVDYRGVLGIGIHSSDHLFAIRAPYWFLVLLAIILGAIP